MKPIHTLASLFCLVGLPACVHGPDYEAPDVDAFVTDAFAADERLNGAARIPIAEDWWTAFEDPTLNALIEEALANNRDIGAALARLRAARSDVLLQRRERLPGGGAEATALRSRTASAAITSDVPSLDETDEPFDDRDLFDLGAFSSWELDLFGRRARLIEAASADAAVADAILRDVQQIVAADVATAYAELRGAELRTRAAERNAALQQTTLETTQRLLGAEGATRLDVARAEASFETTRASLFALEADRKAAHNRLAVLIGRAPAKFDIADYEDFGMPSLPERIPLIDPTQLIQQRPDVRAAERRLAAETARIGVEVSNYYPRLIVSGDVGLRAAEVSNLTSDAAFRYSIGPQLSFGLFDFPRTGARVARQRANTEAALAAFDQTVLNALEETETALVAFALERERTATLRRAADASLQAREFAVKRFEGGISDYLDVLDAERSLREAEDRLATSRATAMVRLIQIYRAFGGGVSPRTFANARP